MAEVTVEEALGLLRISKPQLNELVARGDLQVVLGKVEKSQIDFLVGRKRREGSENFEKYEDLEFLWFYQATLALYLSAYELERLIEVGEIRAIRGENTAERDVRFRSEEIERLLEDVGKPVAEDDIFVGDDDIFSDVGDDDIFLDDEAGEDDFDPDWLDVPHPSSVVSPEERAAVMHGVDTKKLRKRLQGKRVGFPHRDPKVVEHHLENLLHVVKKLDVDLTNNRFRFQKDVNAARKLLQVELQKVTAIVDACQVGLAGLTQLEGFAHDGPPPASWQSGENVNTFLYRLVKTIRDKVVDVIHVEDELELEFKQIAEEEREIVREEKQHEAFSWVAGEAYNQSIGELALPGAEVVDCKIGERIPQFEVITEGAVGYIVNLVFTDADFVSCRVHTVDELIYLRVMHEGKEIIDKNSSLGVEVLRGFLDAGINELRKKLTPKPLKDESDWIALVNRLIAQIEAFVFDKVVWELEIFKSLHENFSRQIMLLFHVQELMESANSEEFVKERLQNYMPELIEYVSNVKARIDEGSNELSQERARNEQLILDQLSRQLSALRDEAVIQLLVHNALTGKEPPQVKYEWSPLPFLVQGIDGGKISLTGHPVDFSVVGLERCEVLFKRPAGLEVKYGVVHTKVNVRFDSPDLVMEYFVDGHGKTMRKQVSAGALFALLNKAQQDIAEAFPLHPDTREEISRDTFGDNLLDVFDEGLNDDA